MKKILIVASLLLAISCGRQPSGLFTVTGGQTVTKCSWGHVDLAPGEERTICEMSGPGILKYFYITDGPEFITDEALVLRFYWDGSDYPSVNVPAADFFGSIGGRPVDWFSKYLAVHHNSHQCYFPMPFSKGARIAIMNDSDHIYSHDMAYNFDFERNKVYRHERSRFHAYYNRSNPTGGSHSILDVKGRGQYVGNILHVYSKSFRWWGEGDTDFILDGTPQKHTPGTEDEYGSCFDLGLGFNQYVCGYIEGGNTDPQARWGVNYNGQNRMFRFYEANPIRFRDSASITIQNQYCAPGSDYDFSEQQEAGDDYSSVAFYYLEGASEVKLIPYAERTAPTKAMDY